jgi:hypothetical protein
LYLASIFDVDKAIESSQGTAKAGKQKDVPVELVALMLNALPSL